MNKNFKLFLDKNKRSETNYFLSLLNEEFKIEGRDLDNILSIYGIDKLQLIAENTNDIICLHHPYDGRYLYATPSIHKIVGYTFEEIKGKTPFDFVHPDYTAILKCNLINSAEGNNEFPEKLELQFKTKNNGYQWFEGYTKPIFNSNSEIVLLLSSTRNIQDRKLAEIERNKSETIRQKLLISSVLFEKKQAIIEKIENEILNLEPQQRKILRGVLGRIQESLNLDENWEDFMIHFQKINPDFHQNIIESYPNLSHKDLKHLAFLKIGMSSTDIAKAMVVKKESLRVSRNRIKKKLGLDSSQSLYDFIRGC